MKVSFEGVGEQILSFNKSSGVSKGSLVKLSANGTVAACAAGSKFAGVCINADNSFADVKTAGYVELGYTGDAPAVGYANLVAASANAVKADVSGREYLIIKVDTSAAKVGFIM